jgi:hypothetical protein
MNSSIFIKSLVNVLISNIPGLLYWKIRWTREASRRKSYQEQYKSEISKSQSYECQNGFSSIIMTQFKQKKTIEVLT